MRSKFLVLFLILGACAETKKDSVPNESVTASAQTQMERGMNALSKEDYATAADIFDNMLVQKPASQFDLLATYNSGVAHEGLGDCKKASELYRRAAVSSAGKFKKVEAEAYFKLSLSYECMGDDKKSITALLDAKKRSAYLSQDVAHAELPARLAAAYARLGQRVKAMQYFREAGNGLKGSLASAGTTARLQTEFAANTLYAMGQLTAKQKNLTDTSRGYLQSLSMQQPYLLQSAEMAVNPASQKAAQELSFAYDNLLKMTPAQPDQVRPFLQLALADIAEIKKIRLPNKGPLVEQIFSKIEVQESNIRQMLMAQADTTPLTPDAQRREGLKQTGRLVDPNTKTKKSQ
jgi:tetratricopeptide (TPR) repeat protein